MNGNEWIAELKVGDAVYTTQRFSAKPEKGFVARLTPKQVMVDFGGRRPDGTVVERAYWIKNGYSVGTDTWSTVSLIQATPEMDQKHLARTRNERAKSMLAKLASREFTLDQSERVITWCVAMIEETNKKGITQS